MKSNALALLAGACILLGITNTSDAQTTEGQDAVRAESRFEFGGSLRTRFEYKDDFRFVPSGGGDKMPGNDEEIFLTQLRLNMIWRASDRIKVFAELQDARIFNESTAINEDASPNIFADDLDLHQAYLDARFDLGGQPATLRLGRQKFNLGAKRLVASLEWVNTARAWDGVRLTVGEAKTRTFDVFASRVVTVNPGEPNDWSKVGNRYWDAGFHGLYFSDWQWIPGARVDLYYLLRDNSDFDDTVHTVGARIEAKREALDYHVELMLQTGDYGGLDHRASALHAEIGHKVGPGRLSLAYDYGSGDDDPSDDEHGTFDNLYPLNHAYYGYMDFFSLQNVHAAEVVWRAPIAGKTVLRVAAHAFWLAEPETDAWYNAGGGVIRRASGDASAFVGSEFDITLSRSFKVAGRPLATQLGYGHFTTGKFVEETGPDEDADFAYFQMKLGF